MQTEFVTAFINKLNELNELLVLKCNVDIKGALQELDWWQYSKYMVLSIGPTYFVLEAAYQARYLLLAGAIATLIAKQKPKTEEQKQE